MKAASNEGCVQISYDVETEGGLEAFTPPFVIGVLADFSGQIAADRPPLMDRRLVCVDRDNFGDVKAKYAPHLNDDEPLPTVWLALQRLVENVDTGLLLKIRLLNVNKSELREDLCGAGNYALSNLYRHIYESEFGMPGGVPYGLLIVDFEIEPDEEDLRLLTALAQVAEKSATQILVAPAPGFLGVQSFDGVSSAHLQNVKLCESWQRFRAHPAARFVSMAMPRFEVSENKYANAAWLVAETVGLAITRYGWPAKIDGELNQTVIDEIRSEFSVSNAQQLELGRQGLMTLSGPDNSAHPSRFSLSTCASDFLLNEMLCFSLFRRAVCMICRDRIGAFMSDEDTVQYLRNWLLSYSANSSVPGSADVRRPLRTSQLVLKSSERQQMALEISIQLGYQFEAVSAGSLNQQFHVPLMIFDSYE